MRVLKEESVCLSLPSALSVDEMSSKGPQAQCDSLLEMEYDGLLEMVLMEQLQKQRLPRTRRDVRPEK